MKKNVSFEKDLSFQTMIGEITSISLEDDLKFVDSSNVSGDFIISGKYKMTEASRLEEDFSFVIPTSIETTSRFDLDTTKINITNFNYEIVDDDTLRCKIDVLIEGVEEVDVSEDVKDEDVDDNICDAVMVDEEKDYDVDKDMEDKTRDGSDIDKIKEIEEPVLDVNGSSDLRECDGDSSKDEIPVKMEEMNVDKEVEVEKVNNIEKEEVVSVSSINQNNMEEIIEEKKMQNEKKVNKTVDSLFSKFQDDDDTFKTYSIHIMREGDNLEDIMGRYKVSREELENYNDLSTIQINSKVIIPKEVNEE